ncbi:MAG TPA: ATP-binding cassette domain-containing protein [Polaromonas sp.]|uniref:ABC transporter ATP-binding protein n=1 Tax=Polaromonas sp. TaxID=1869339 RepID=UPI002D3389F4|nr:ATP-binding cassette domain-containing protein [Polaromonas sp.]HYW56673.1 ATP-binding cassette domain-containing protein [Polaromonas sp.]
MGTRRTPGFVSNTGMKSPISPAILEVKSLNFGYPGHALFSQWSASLPPGVSLVLGGDGRGKTTLLRLLAGELVASAGELVINGLSLTTHAKEYRQRVFWIEPRTLAFDQMTPAVFFDLRRGAYAGFDDRTLSRYVDGLALGPDLDKQLFMLSTGSRRKVWLAAAFASGAALTLLDMPFAALDRASIVCVLSMLNEVAAHPERTFVVADYTAPVGVLLAATIDLGG